MSLYWESVGEFPRTQPWRSQHSGHDLPVFVPRDGATFAPGRHAACALLYVSCSHPLYSKLTMDAAGVAWIERDCCHIEFHITSTLETTMEGTNPSRRRRRHVQHVVLRLRQHDMFAPTHSTSGPVENALEQYFTDGVKGLLSMKRALRELPGLQSITVEESGPGSSRFGPAATVSTSVLWTTCAEASSAAAAADTPAEPGSGRDTHRRLASPFWHLQQYESAWDRWVSWNTSANPAPAAQCIAAFEGRSLLEIVTPPTSAVKTNRPARHPRSDLQHLAMALHEDADGAARKEDEVLGRAMRRNFPWPRYECSASDPTLAMARGMQYGSPLPESELDTGSSSTRETRRGIVQETV